MLLRLTSRTPDARDLGYLLRKNPARTHEFDLSCGRALVFYPVAEEDVCTAVLLVEVDPVGLVRRPGGGDDWSTGQYVNDRPYSASSLLSTAMSHAFGSALNRRCRDRPDLVDRPLDLELELPVVHSPGGAPMMERLFAPLGYAVEVSPHPLEPAFPDWGDSRHARVVLRQRIPVWQALNHLAVLVPALDRFKHYFVGDAEVGKLLQRGEGWLPDHPEKDWIASRYLKYRSRLTRIALARLAPEEAETDDPEVAPEVADDEATDSAGDGSANGPAGSRRKSLHDQRLDRVLELIAERAPQSVLDLGCGEGKLTARLLRKTRIPKITAMDVSVRSLEIARRRFDRLPPRQRERLTLLHGSLVYRDARLAGHDCAALVEVVEHLDPHRLAAMERVVFECARPRCVILTTPNRDYNALFPSLPAGEFRHDDHRFEWTREEFAARAARIAEAHGYSVTLEGIGEPHPDCGSPSQAAVFERPDAG